MVQPNELRIGNWVEVLAFPGSPQERWERRQITGQFLHLMEHGGMKARQILLTPEILEACGFARKDAFFHGSTEKGAVYAHPELYPDINERTPGEFELMINDEAGYHLCDLHNLHQLQNAFFVFAEGQELTVNLPATHAPDESLAKDIDTTEAIPEYVMCTKTGKVFMPFAVENHEPIYGIKGEAGWRLRSDCVPSTQAEFLAANPNLSEQMKLMMRDCNRNVGNYE